MKEIIEAYFASRKEDVISIGWTLSTSDEHAIEENWYETYSGDSAVDWDVITDSVRDFESSYRSILEPYGTHPREFGHNSYDYLVGDLDVTVENLITILESGEGDSSGEVVINTSSGNFYCEEIDKFLHPTMDAALTFYIPSELYELL